MMWIGNGKFTFSLAMVFAIVFSCVAHAEEELTEKELNEKHLVEVQVHQDSLAPYKERQEDHGLYFRVSMEDLLLKKFTSAIDGLNYTQILRDKPTRLALVGFEYKYNMGLGAISLGAQFGKGNAADIGSGQERILNVTKTGLGVKFTADKFGDEPYVAPYVGLTASQLEIHEDSLTVSKNEKTDVVYNYTIGMLIQLDWLDRATAKTTTFNWGLENTFLDIYATQYAKSGSAEDPDTETDFVFGGGLCLEF